MKTSITAFSKIISREDLVKELHEIVSILTRHNINRVEISFGFMWGREADEWINYDILTTEIISRIEEEEQLQEGKFGRDDFWISIKELEVEILFCHESDIHLYYNYENIVVREILENWEQKKIFQTKKQDPA